MKLVDPNFFFFLFVWVLHKFFREFFLSWHLKLAAKGLSTIVVFYNFLSSCFVWGVVFVWVIFGVCSGIFLIKAVCACKVSGTLLSSGTNPPTFQSSEGLLIALLRFWNAVSLIAVNSRAIITFIILQADRCAPEPLLMGRRGRWGLFDFHMSSLSQRAFLAISGTEGSLLAWRIN